MLFKLKWLCGCPAGRSDRSNGEQAAKPVNAASQHEARRSSRPPPYEIPERNENPAGGDEYETISLGSPSTNKALPPLPSSVPGPSSGTPTPNPHPPTSRPTSPEWDPDEILPVVDNGREMKTLNPGLNAQHNLVDVLEYRKQLLSVSEGLTRILEPAYQRLHRSSRWIPIARLGLLAKGVGRKRRKHLLPYRIAVDWWTKFDGARFRKVMLASENGNRYRSAIERTNQPPPHHVNSHAHIIL